MAMVYTILARCSPLASHQWCNSGVVDCIPAATQAYAVETTTPSATTAATTVRLLLPPFGSTILKPHLNPRLGELKTTGDIFTSQGIGVRTHVKGRLEHRELVDGEGCSMSRFLHL